uniref:Uncharacterized protein n=1 Tax=Glossina austeni TaxID=7395 RepID=A0A1A9UUG6_GLOAU
MNNSDDIATTGIAHVHTHIQTQPQAHALIIKIKSSQKLYELYGYSLNKHKIKDQFSDELIKIFNNIKQFLMFSFNVLALLLCTSGFANVSISSQIRPKLIKKRSTSKKSKVMEIYRKDNRKRTHVTWSKYLRKDGDKSLISDPYV